VSYSDKDPWMKATIKTVESYRKMIDGAVVQLSDAELFARPRADINSVAIILRHLGGNLLSRWTDFFTTDGEKPDRDRDSEFNEWEGDRDSLIAYFNSGWERFTHTLEQIDASNSHATVVLRGEPHSVAEAVMRALTHISYHVGQIVLISRMVHDGDWRWLTIKPGGSKQFNQDTWGPVVASDVASPPIKKS
jgi:hypothetical protein